MCICRYMCVCICACVCVCKCVSVCKCMYTSCLSLCLRMGVPSYRSCATPTIPVSAVLPAVMSWSPGPLKP